MKYKILRDIDYKDLEKEVNSAIEHGGWKPLGGLCFEVPEYGVTWFYQAMTLEEEEEK